MVALRVDANVLLRFLTDEPPELAERAARLFATVSSGETQLVIEEVVAAEVVWTMSSYYRRSKEEISAALLALFAHENILCADKSAIQMALVLFHEKNLDFADALLAAKTLGSEPAELYSFDRDFDRVPGITRREPD